MAATPIIDAHLHIYPSREQGLRAKSTYQVWEYGEKADVRFSRYAADAQDAVTAIRESRIDRAIVVNLFAITRARQGAIAELPADLDEPAREQALGEIEATMGERLKRSNRDVCELARRHRELIPFVAADPWALASREGEGHLRDMVTNHGARGVKLHPILQQFAIGDSRMFPIYEACVDLAIPIIAHSGPSRTDPQFAEPRAFAEVLRAFPRLSIVLAPISGAGPGDRRSRSLAAFRTHISTAAKSWPGWERPTRPAPSSSRD